MSRHVPIIHLQMFQNIYIYIKLNIYRSHTKMTGKSEE